MKSVDFSLTVFISGIVVLKALLALVVMAVLVVLVKMAVLVMLVTRAVLVVMVMAASSCFTNTTTTPMRVPNATNTKEATPIFMNFQQFTVKPASASLSSSF